MKPLPETLLHESIGDALELLAAAKDAVKNAVSYAQSNCDHRFVCESPWSKITGPQRICKHCRFEETGSNWSGGSSSVWSRFDHGPSDLGNIEGRIVVSVSSSEFDKMRVKV